MSLIQTFVTANSVDLNMFASIMSRLGLNGRVKIAVALSGGSDSLCLALLLHQWAKLHQAEVTALIVNHKLRANIEEEISLVVSWLQQYGINYAVLPINKLDTHSKVQQNARSERYRVLLQYCKEHQISYLAVAHHFNDLIETVVMRNKRGESIWGNSGISLVKNFNQVLIFRPLLFFTKSALKNTLTKMGQEWVTDPSNANPKYERVAVRQALGDLSAEEIKYYVDLITDFREHRITLEQECLNYLIQHSHISRFGELSISLTSFLALQQDLQIALIRLILKFISGREYMVRIHKVKAFLQQLKLLNEKNINKKITLGNCLIKLVKLEPLTKLNPSHQLALSLTFGKEVKSVIEKTLIGDITHNQYLWGGRFLINSISLYPKNYFFANLHPNEYNNLIKDSEFKAIIKQLSLTKEVTIALPWLFDDKNSPSISWAHKLLEKDSVIFAPKNSLLQDRFYNFSLAKGNQLG